MINASFGDLASSFVQRTRNTALKQQIDRLTGELASGRISETREILSGNTSYLTDIESRISTLSGYRNATAEATHFATGLQLALNQINETGLNLAGSLLAASNGIAGPAGADVGPEAQNAMRSIVGRLNAQVAGRHIFSGTATDRPPLPDADTILAGLSAAIAGATTPDTMITAARDWFDDPAGFAGLMYSGSNDDLAPIALSPTERVNLDIKATDPRLGKTLSLIGVAAIAEDPAFALDTAQLTELFGKAGQNLLVAQDDVISMQSNVGFVEARIEKVAARNAAEGTSLDFARKQLISIDPFEAATRLEQTQFQLQSLYSVTVSMSRLSLVNFL